MAPEASGRESDQLSKIKVKAAGQFSKVAGQAEEIANRVHDQGREVSESMQNVARNFKGALDSSIGEQPVATLVTAAIVGFLLGALWKS